MKYVLTYVLENKFSVGYFLDNHGMTENIEKAMQFNSEDAAIEKKRQLDKIGLEGVITIVPILENEDYSEERFKKNLESNHEAKRYLKPKDYKRIVEYKYEHVKIEIIDIVPEVNDFFLVAKYQEGKNKGKIASFHTDSVIW